LFSRAAKDFGIANKHVSCSAAQRKFWNCEQTHCIWFSRAGKILEVRPKALYFFQPRREKFWICDQKHCILFAKRNFGITNKSTLFGSAAQRIFGNCDLQHCIFFSLHGLTKHSALVAIPKPFSARLNKIQCFWSQLQKFLCAADPNRVLLFTIPKFSLRC
jgi:hypothetical protein